MTTFRCDGCGRVQDAERGYEIRRPERTTYLKRRVKYARCRRCSWNNIWPDSATIGGKMVAEVKA